MKTFIFCHPELIFANLTDFYDENARVHPPEEYCNFRKEFHLSLSRGVAEGGGGEGGRGCLPYVMFGLWSEASPQRTFVWSKSFSIVVQKAS